MEKRINTDSGKEIQMPTMRKEAEASRSPPYRSQRKEQSTGKSSSPLQKMPSESSQVGLSKIGGTGANRTTDRGISKALDILQWVGARFYTIESFIKEAERYGVCKRVNGLPVDITIGKSRVFLIHDTSEEDKKAKKRGVPRVFGYFTIQSILVVGAKDIAEREGIKIQRVAEAEIGSFERRGCGLLQIGGTYLVSDEDMKKLQKHADMAKGQLQTITPPIEVPELKRFRGYKYVDGDAILNRLPIDQWTIKVKEVRSKPKEERETFRQTVMRILSAEKKIKLTTLIQVAIMQNKPTSKRPQWVYKDVIRKLRKEGLLEVAKVKGERVVSIKKAKEDWKNV